MRGAHLRAGLACAAKEVDNHNPAVFIHCFTDGWAGQDTDFFDGSPNIPHLQAFPAALFFASIQI